MTRNATILSMVAGTAFYLSWTSAGMAGKDLVRTQVVITPQIMLERAHRQSLAVRDAVRKALVDEPKISTVDFSNTYFLATETPSEVIETSTSDGSTDASGDTEDQTLSWSAWADGAYTRLDDNMPMSSYDGYQLSSIIGLDRTISDRVVIGVIGNWNTSHIDDTFLSPIGGFSETDGKGIGVYAGALITDQITADISYLYSWTDNHAFDGFDTANYGSNGWTITGNVTGNWYNGNWRLSPTAGVSWSHNIDEAYVDSAFAPFPSQEQNVGSMTFGSTVGYSFDLPNAATAEVWTSATGEWTFERSQSPSATAFAIPVRGEDFDVRIAGGIDLATPSGITFSLSGEISGVAIRDYLSTEAKISVSIPF